MGWPDRDRRRHGRQDGSRLLWRSARGENFCFYFATRRAILRSTAEGRMTAGGSPVWTWCTRASDKTRSASLTPRRARQHSSPANSRNLPEHAQPTGPHTDRAGFSLPAGQTFGESGWQAGRTSRRWPVPPLTRPSRSRRTDGFNAYLSPLDGCEAPFACGGLFQNSPNVQSRDPRKRTGSEVSHD
jgi:hypothetical protein